MIGTVRLLSSCLIGLLLVGGCDTEEEIRLIVDVRTDLTPTADFSVVDVAAVPTSSTAEVTTSRRVMPGDDYVTGQRVAEYEGLPPGPTRVRVRLSMEGGVLALERTVRVDLAGRTGVTIVMTRDCIGVACPGDGDEDGATQCIGGRCVPETCVDLQAEACGGAVCAGDGECPGDGLCTEGRCAGGACLAPTVPGCMMDGAVPDASDAGDAPDAVAIDLGEFLAAADALLCERILACSPKITFVAEALCNPELRPHGSGFLNLAFSTFPWLDPGPGATFDPDAATACLAALEAVPADDCSVLPPPACVGVFVGTLGDGEACVGHAECLMGRCDELGDVCPGYCRRLLTEGEACTSTTECAASLRCIGSLCAPPAAVGETCDTTTPCEFGALCDAGVCRVGPVVGDACTVGFFGFDPCVGTAVCAAGTCAAPVPPGGACSGAMRCGSGARCVAGRCQLTARPGAPCLEDSQCPATFACVGGLCEPLGFEGSACSAPAECMVGTCIGGTCTLASAGSICSATAQCTGYCDGTTCAPAAAEGEPCGESPSFNKCEPSLVCRSRICEACP